MRIRDLLAAKLDRDFGPKDEHGRRKRGQRQICAKIGITQPVLADIENASGSLGVHALIALRDYLETPIDDLLDLEPLPAKPAVTPLPTQPPPSPLTPEAIEDIVVRAMRRAERGESPSTEPAPKKGPPDALRPVPRRR